MIRRRKNAKFYDENLKGVNTPYVLEGVNHAYHQYTIKCNKRDMLLDELKKNEIGYGIYYPKPLHLYNHLVKFGHKDLKVSEKLASEVLSIPVHPLLVKKDIDYCWDAVKEGILSMEEVIRFITVPSTSPLMCTSM